MTDPDPVPPVGGRMTDAEFKVVREYLGLTGDWLAGHLDVDQRTVRSWEQGRYPIPDGVRLDIEDLEHRTAAFTEGVIGKLLDVAEPVVLVYRTDADYHRAVPGSAFPASWHRAVIARVAQEVPGLSIAFAEPPQREK